MTVNEMLAKLRAIKKAKGGSALVLVSAKKMDGGSIPNICVVDAVVSADTPIDSIFKGVDVVLIEAEF